MTNSKRNDNNAKKLCNNADIEEYTSLTVKRRAARVTDCNNYLINGHRRKLSSISQKSGSDLNTVRRGSAANNSNENFEEITMPALMKELTQK